MFSSPQTGDSQGSAIVVPWRKLHIKRLRMWTLLYRIHFTFYKRSLACYLWNFWHWVNLKNLLKIVSQLQLPICSHLSGGKNSLLQKIFYCSFDELCCIFSWHYGTFQKKKKKNWENCFLRGCAMIFLGPEQYLILLFPWGGQFDEVVLRGGCKPILFMTLLILSKFPKAWFFDLYTCSSFHVALKEICNAQSTF